MGLMDMSGNTFIIVSHAPFKIYSRGKFYPHSSAETGFPIDFSGPLIGYRTFDSQCKS